MGNASPPPMQLPVLSPPSLFSSPYRLISSDFLLPPPPCHLFSSATHHLSCSSFFLHSSLSDGHHLQKANRKKQQSLGLGVGGGSSYKMAAKVRMDILMSGDCCFFFLTNIIRFVCFHSRLFRKTVKDNRADRLQRLLQEESEQLRLRSALIEFFCFSLR